MSKQPKHFYEFGPFVLDPTERQLRRNGSVLPLTPKALDVLLLLVENSGHALKKEEVFGEGLGGQLRRGEESGRQHLRAQEGARRRSAKPGVHREPFRATATASSPT